MTATVRSERTARLLALRLEELGCALERSRGPSEVAGRLLESASVATMHAIDLELVTSERAAAIWTDAASRHPALTAAPVAQRLAVRRNG